MVAAHTNTNANSLMGVMSCDATTRKTADTKLRNVDCFLVKASADTVIDAISYIEKLNHPISNLIYGLCIGIFKKYFPK